MAPSLHHADAPVSVHASLTFEVVEPSTIELLIVPADSAGERADEQLTVTVDGDPLAARHIDTFPLEGTTATVVAAAVGELVIEYSTTVHRHPSAPSAVADLARASLLGLRPGRYTPSDELAGFASTLFGHGNPAETAEGIAAWVTAQLAYDPAATRPTGTAADTLLSGAGVCRDFAHLTAALCRAVDIPSRIAAVYAPGLSPMDFHAVTEVLIGDRWFVFDTTRLAPRPSLVRIAIGRDAADTAFANVVGGAATLTSIDVVAVLEADALPDDDHTGLVELR